MNDEQKRRDEQVRYVCENIASGNYNADPLVVRFLWRAYERVVKEQDTNLARAKSAIDAWAICAGELDWMSTDDNRMRLALEAAERWRVCNDKWESQCNEQRQRAEAAEANAARWWSELAARTDGAATPKVWTDDDGPKPAPVCDPMYIHREHDPGTDAEMQELRTDNDRLRGELTRMRSELRAVLEGDDNGKA